jgi:hypothetical protein
MRHVVWKGNLYPDGTASPIICSDNLIDYVNKLWKEKKNLESYKTTDFEHCWLDPNIPPQETFAYAITVVDDLQDHYLFQIKPEAYSAVLDCFRKKGVTNNIMMVPFPSYLLVIPEHIGVSLEKKLLEEEKEFKEQEDTLMKSMQEQLKSMIVRGNTTGEA